MTEWPQGSGVIDVPNEILGGTGRFNISWSKEGKVAKSSPPPLRAPSLVHRTRVSCRRGAPRRDMQQAQFVNAVLCKASPLATAWCKVALALLAPVVGAQISVPTGLLRTGGGAKVPHPEL